MSRRERISYQPAMNKIPAYLDQYLGRNSFVLIYPYRPVIRKPLFITHNTCRIPPVRTAPFYRCNGDIRRMSEHGLSADEETLHPR